MTIEKGKDWGRIVADRSGGEPIEGDLALEVGVEPDPDTWKRTSTWLELPLDVLDVTFTFTDGTSSRHSTTGSVVCGRSAWGEFCIVASTSFVKGRRIFDRAHPNDGRLDWLRFAPTMTFRQRLAFTRRTRLGTHLPHPDVKTGTGRTYETTFGRPVNAYIGEKRFRGVIALSVALIPDGTITHIPADGVEADRGDLL